MPHSDEMKSWIDKGESDIESARVLLENKPPLRDTAVFHCQQAAEKYLKAYLIDQGVSFERSHNLVYLLDLCTEVDPSLARLSEPAALLTPYAVLMRYPGRKLQPSQEEADAAFNAASQVVAAVKELI